MTSIKNFFSKYAPQVVVSGLMLFSLIVGSLLIAFQSLRLDEAQSLWQTSHTPSKLLFLVAQDVHVPLYHLLLDTWQLAFGSSITSARSMSLVLFLLAIPVVYLLGREVLSRQGALIGTALFSLSPFMNWYGSEARMYSLLVLMAALNQLFFLRAIKRGGGSNRLAYFLSAVGGLYTHYFFVLVIATQFVFFLTQRRNYPAGTLKRLLPIMIAAGLMLAPWLYYVVSLGSASGTKPLLATPTTVDLFNTFSQFLFGFQEDRLNTFIVSLWPLAVLLGFLTLQRRRLTPETLYLAFAAVFPILFAFLFSLFVRPFYLSRYLIVALPAMMLFLAWTFSTYGRKLRLAVAGVIVLAMTASLALEATNPNNPQRENYAGAAQYLEEHAEPQDIIVVSAPFTIYPIEYYYNGPVRLATLPIWDRFATGSAPAYDAKKLPAEAKQLAGSHQRLWLLQSYDQGYEEEMRLYFDKNYERLQKRELSNGLTLYEYKTRYDPTVELTSAP